MYTHIGMKTKVTSARGPHKFTGTLRIKKNLDEGMFTFFSNQLLYYLALYYYRVEWIPNPR